MPIEFGQTLTAVGNTEEELLESVIDQLALSAPSIDGDSIVTLYRRLQDLNRVLQKWKGE